jgi:hypothetical protein
MTIGHSACNWVLPFEKPDGKTEGRATLKAASLYRNAQGIEAEIPQDPPEAGTRNWSGKPGFRRVRRKCAQKRKQKFLTHHISAGILMRYPVR